MAIKIQAPLNEVKATTGQSVVICDAAELPFTMGSKNRSALRELGKKKKKQTHYTSCFCVLVVKTPGVLLVQHKTRGFSCRKTSKEGHVEKSGVFLYAYAAHFLSVPVRPHFAYRHQLLQIEHKFIQTVPPGRIEETIKPKAEKQRRKKESPQPYANLR